MAIVHSHRQCYYVNKLADKFKLAELTAVIQVSTNCCKLSTVLILGKLAPTCPAFEKCIQTFYPLLVSLKTTKS